MRRPFPAVAAVALTALLVANALGPAAPAHAGPAGPATFTVNSLNDAIADFTNDPNFDICRTSVANTTCTLRAAIMNANQHVGGATIHLPAGLYMLQIPAVFPSSDANGDLNISNTVTTIGAGSGLSAIEGGEFTHHFGVYASGVLTLTGVTLQNGNNPFGGAIVDAGWVSLTNSVLKHNQAVMFGGGGLYVADTAAASLDRVTVTQNEG